jgi:hypothetical protein
MSDDWHSVQSMTRGASVKRSITHSIMMLYGINIDTTQRDELLPLINELRTAVIACALPPLDDVGDITEDV